MIRSRFLTLVFAMLMLLGLCHVEAAGVVEGPTCIVIPARQTIVQFSFDILRLRRQIYLVAHDKEIGGTATVLHVWDDGSQDWVRIGVEEYVAGTVFTQIPKKLIVIGGEKDVPEELATAPAWAGSEAYQIESLNLVTVLNKLQVIFLFNEREWKWIADRYKISYEDMNAERRRYGRYGKPGAEKSTAMPGASESEELMTVPEGPIEIISAPEPELRNATVVEEEVMTEVVVEEEIKAADKLPQDK